MDSKVSRRQFGKQAVLGAVSVCLPTITRHDFEPFIHPLAGTFYRDHLDGQLHRRLIGLSGGVSIDRRKGIVKKEFVPGTMTSGGFFTRLDRNELRRRFCRERDTYLKLKAIGSAHIPKKIHFDDKNNAILMDYLGPDLIINSKFDFKNLLEQTIEIFQEYKRIGVFKVNFSLGHLFEDQGRLYSIGFSQTRHRSLRLLEHEIKSLFAINKLSLLRGQENFLGAFDDFDTSAVKNIFDRWIAKRESYLLKLTTRVDV